MNGTIQVVIMQETEARLLVTEIKAGITSIGEKLLELYDREGWKALGYGSWEDCVMTEFDFSHSHIYRLLSFAKIKRNILESPIGDSLVPPKNEAQTRPLSDLPPAEQPAAWKATQQRTGSVQPPAREVAETVRQVRSIPKPTKSGSKPKSPSTGYSGSDNQGSRGNGGSAPKSLPLSCDDKDWRVISRAFGDPAWAATVLLAAAGFSERELSGLLGIERMSEMAGGNPWDGA